MITFDQLLPLIKSSARETVHEQASFSEVTVQTTDATATEILRVTPEDNACGLITMQVVGSNSTGGVAGIKAARFTKYSGTITVATPVDIMPLSGITGVALTIAADGVDLVASVTGVAATTINWKGDYKLITVVNEVAL